MRKKQARILFEPGFRCFEVKAGPQRCAMAMHVCLFSLYVKQADW
jgi:hypothetical protein